MWSNLKAFNEPFLLRITHLPMPNHKASKKHLILDWELVTMSRKVSLVFNKVFGLLFDTLVFWLGEMIKRWSQ